MSASLVHIQQSNHNKYLAQFLLRFQTPFKDWVVTTCFYSAVHIAEALFSVLKPFFREHSETTKPITFPGGLHGWRKSLINELVTTKKISRDFLIIYSNLHIQSNISRYLIQPIGGRPKTYSSLNRVSYDFFSRNDIKDFVRKDLAALEKEATFYLSQIKIPHDSRYSFLSMLKRWIEKLI